MNQLQADRRFAILRQDFAPRIVRLNDDGSFSVFGPGQVGDDERRRVNVRIVNDQGDYVLTAEFFVGEDADPLVRPIILRDDQQQHDFLIRCNDFLGGAR